MKDWHVGQKCICIKDLQEAASIYRELGWPQVNFPSLNQILVIRQVCTRKSMIGQEVLTLLFEEIVNPVMLLNCGRTAEPAFGDWDFRPLEESRLDQFRAHLKTDPKRVEEKV